MDFDTAFDRLLGHEGGFSDHKDDPGGKTRFGVTEAVARANGYKGDMRDLPKEVAKDIYRRLYWNPCRCDDLPAAIRFDVFDAAVNSGVVQAIKWLQRAIGATADGLIGPVTLKAAANANPDAVRRQFNGARLLLMTDLKTWPAFGRGWAKRVAQNLLT